MGRLLKTVHIISVGSRPPVISHVYLHFTSMSHQVSIIQSATAFFLSCVLEVMVSTDKGSATLLNFFAVSPLYYIHSQTCTALELYANEPFYYPITG